MTIFFYLVATVSVLAVLVAMFTIKKSDLEVMEKVADEIIDELILGEDTDCPPPPPENLFADRIIPQEQEPEINVTPTNKPTKKHKKRK